MPAVEGQSRSAVDYYVGERRTSLDALDSQGFTASRPRSHLPPCQLNPERSATTLLRYAKDDDWR